MSKGLTWRVSLILLFIILSFLYLTPTLVAKLPSWWQGVLPKDKIHLGLDLQGGTHLVMEVETQKAVEGALDMIATDLEDTLTAQTLRFKRIVRTGADRVQVTLYDKGTAENVQKQIKKKYPELELLPTFDEGGFVNLQLRMNEKVAQDRKDKAVAQALETIRNRIDQFGVSEPVIQREGIDHIVVQDTKTGERSEVKVDGVFVYVGANPATAFLGDLVERDKAGFVLTDDNLSTKTKGLFVAGDVRKKILRQISTAVGDGALAAVMAERYILEKK